MHIVCFLHAGPTPLANLSSTGVRDAVRCRLRSSACMDARVPSGAFFCSASRARGPLGAPAHAAMSADDVPQWLQARHLRWRGPSAREAQPKAKAMPPQDLKRLRQHTTRWLGEPKKSTWPRQHVAHADRPRGRLQDCHDDAAAGGRRQNRRPMVPGHFDVVLRDWLLYGFSSNRAFMVLGRPVVAPQCRNVKTGLATGAGRKNDWKKAWTCRGTRKSQDPKGRDKYLGRLTRKGEPEWIACVPDLRAFDCGTHKVVLFDDGAPVNRSAAWPGRANSAARSPVLADRCASMRHPA